jgi:hypothetical protein
VLTYWDPDAITAQMEELKTYFFIEREEIIRRNGIRSDMQNYHN